MDGVILVDKPMGMTSFSLASKVRRLTGAKKSGHAGTLDPMATGVMAVMLGNATKLSEYLTTEDKRYTARIKFGIITDTMDIQGEITERRKCEFTADELLQAVSRLSGKITQIPPKYSAIKVNGRRLYSYARSGEEVSIPSREVEIYEFSILEFDQKEYEAVADIYCSKGTYIRSLANDLGEILGCGATLTELRRTKSGSFDIGKCISPEEITEDGKWMEKLISCEDVIGFMPRADVDSGKKRQLVNGNAIESGHYTLSEPSELYRIFCEDVFYAVGRVEEGVLKVVKMIKVGSDEDNK